MLADSPQDTASQQAVPPAETPGLSGLLTLAVAVVVVAALSVGQDVFVPIVLAVLLSFVLAPVANYLRGFIGRISAVIVAVVLALGILLALGTVIGSQVAQLAADIPRYQHTINDKVSALQNVTTGRLSELMNRFGREIERAAKENPPAGQAASVPPAATAPADGPPKPLLVQVVEPDAKPLQILGNYLGPVLHPLATTFIVVVVVIFILMQREDLRDRMIRLFGASDLHRTTVAMDDAASRLSRYFLTQLALNAVFGVAISIGLWLIGVPSPVLWGVITALMRFVPYVGAFLSAAMPFALAAAVEPGWSMALSTLALFLIAEPIMGHVIEPLAYGHSTGLSPFAVVVSAIFWTWLWGPIGLLLSTPLTVCLVVLGRHVERLEFLDVLLGDRPALSPIESFYQRMLAGDPDEAQEHAEQLLKERSLSSYYDEVVLKGLQLAANDAKRGVLAKVQLDRINQAIKALVHDLDDYSDVDPPPAATKDKASPVAVRSDQKLPKQPAVVEQAPDAADLPPRWRGEGAVMCIAGRGPLDEASSEMLAQLLRKHGLGARVVPHNAVSRSNVNSLDVTGVAMVCISYLEISGSPAHLRYLIRRLRARLPKAPLLVGLWPSDDDVLTDAELRSSIGADYFVSSLGDAVGAVMKAARAAAQEEPAETPAKAEAAETPSAAPLLQAAV